MAVGRAAMVAGGLFLKEYFLKEYEGKTLCETMGFPMPVNPHFTG
jgi:hypothetical protein